MNAATWSDTDLRRAGWVTLFVIVSILVLETVIVAGTGTNSSIDGSPTILAESASAVLALCFPVVGLVIVHRQPRNRMGWLLLLGVGTATSLPSLLYSYAALGVAAPDLPGRGVAAGLVESGWVWSMGAVGVFVILLFPDGRLPSRWWRWLPPVALTTMTIIAACISFGSPTLNEGPVDGMTNTLFVEPLATPLLLVLRVVLPLLPACSLAAAVALLGRFRRSRGIERQQLKWLAEAGVLVATFFLTAMAAQLLRPSSVTGTNPVWLSVLWNVVLASLLLLPIAIGIAILRHGLYDIDRILNRTVVYAVLTAALVGTYLVSVLLFRLVLDPLLGRSDLAVAASTLAVAAAFRPVRTRIQDAVDRRFFRSRYDAARTVESFAGRLRHEVDLQAVSTDLEVVVRDAVQPAHVSLWLRGTR